MPKRTLPNLEKSIEIIVNNPKLIGEIFLIASAYKSQEEKKGFATPSITVESDSFDVVRLSTLYRYVGNYYKLHHKAIEMVLKKEEPFGSMIIEEKILKKGW